MTHQPLEKNSLEDCLSDASIREEALFVLSQADCHQIKTCSDSGAHILLPNLSMNHSLIYRTIIREAKEKVVLSSSIWDKMKETFEMSNPFMSWNPELVIYKN